MPCDHHQSLAHQQSQYFYIFDVTAKLCIHMRHANIQVFVEVAELQTDEAGSAKPGFFVSADLTILDVLFRDHKHDYQLTPVSCFRLSASSHKKGHISLFIKYSGSAIQ